MPLCFGCCDRDEDEYADVQTGASVSKDGQSQERIKDRGSPAEGDDGHDSDYVAVQWIRSRSSDPSTTTKSPKPAHLTEKEALAWQQARGRSSSSSSRTLQTKATSSGGSGSSGPSYNHYSSTDKNRMATLESIEIEELSQYRNTTPRHNETMSTADESLDLEPRSSPRPTYMGRSSSSGGRSTPRGDLEELDYIVQAIQYREQLQSRSSPRPITPSRKDSKDRKGRVGWASDQHRSVPSNEYRPTSNSRFPQAPLSDIPSDVDPNAKERYLMACRLLKSALFQHEKTLMPTEKQFLQGLIEEEDPTDEHVSAVETASATLLSDPLFQVESVNTSCFEEVVATDRISTSDDTRVVKNRNNRGLPALVDDEDDVLTDVDASFLTDTETATSVARFEGKDMPFYILGVTPNFKVGVLSPTLMEALRSFFPQSICEENFWLKFSLQRDGTSLPTLLSKVRTSQHTILGVETTDGYVFGAFCSSPWRVQPSWFGSRNCFLWRLKRPRLRDGAQSVRRNFSNDNEMEVYPCTGKDPLIQYCTRKTIAIGGGDWRHSGGSPYPKEPTGIGFMIDGDLMGGETNSCATFANPRLGQRVSTNNEFDIRALEVWTGK